MKTINQIVENAPPKATHYCVVRQTYYAAAHGAYSVWSWDCDTGHYWSTCDRSVMPKTLVIL